MPGIPNHTPPVTPHPTPRATFWTRKAPAAGVVEVRAAEHTSHTTYRHPRRLFFPLSNLQSFLFYYSQVVSIGGLRHLAQPSCSLATPAPTPPSLQPVPHHTNPSAPRTLHHGYAHHAQRGLYSETLCSLTTTVFKCFRDDKHGFQVFILLIT